jgi:hypothetical protein
MEGGPDAPAGLGTDRPDGGSQAAILLGLLRRSASSPSRVSYWSPARTDVMRCVLKPNQCIRPT